MTALDLLLTVLPSNVSVKETETGAFKWISYTVHGTECGRGKDSYPTRWQAANDYLIRFKPELAKA